MAGMQDCYRYCTEINLTAVSVHFVFVCFVLFKKFICGSFIAKGCWCARAHWFRRVHLTAKNAISGFGNAIKNLSFHQALR